MKQYAHTLWLTSGISLLYLTTISPSQAQLVPDTSLPVNSTVASKDNVSTISGGTVVDRNLFHSFNEFNVGEGQKANFVSPSAAIQNIIVRVTGNSRSEIMGTLSTSGLSTPNLFLINPRGIIFGTNASLEVGGSFVATTANAIEFGNQGFFSASVPNDPGLLTVNPSAFLFNQITTSSIENNSIAPAGFNRSGLELIGLRVPDNRSLLLVGGNVTLDNGQLHGLGGRVELGGVAGSGIVGLNVEDNNLRLSYPASAQSADVLLTNGAQVNVVAGGKGSIAINARNLNALNGSVLQAGIGEDLESDGTQAGDITLDATEAMEIVGSRVTNNVEFGAVGDAGSILIKAGSLSLSDSAELSASAFGQGKTGGISVRSNNFVSIARSYITTGPGEETGLGNGGDINIQTKNISLTDQSQLDTSTSVEGRAANVIIDARNTVSLENSFISSQTFGAGNAGIIDINARELSLTKGAVLLSETSGEGNAGTIQINTADSVRISGVSSESGFSSGLVTSTEEENSGQGGNISVTTGTLSISDGAVLSARTRNGSPGGDITVKVNTLQITNGGQFLTSAFNSGDAGNITVNAIDSVTISGSDLTFEERVARFARFLGRVDNDGPDSGLFARVRGNAAANAGNIEVKARSIRLDNKGTLTAATTSGEGGNINLEVKDLILLRRQGLISTEARNNGNGGNIRISTPYIVAVPSENSDMVANAFRGNGGNINITASGIFGLEYRDRLTPNSDINASSDFGVDGAVEIDTPDVDPSRGLVELPVQPTETQVVQACTPGGSQQQSEFIITGGGGLQPNPTEALSTDAVQVDWVALAEPRGESTALGGEMRRLAGGESFESNSPHYSITPSPTVEAQGWVVGENGEVVLTASAAPVLPHTSWHNPTSCRATQSDTRR